MPEVLTLRSQVLGPELREARRFSLDRTFAESLSIYGLTVAEAQRASLVVPAHERLLLSDALPSITCRTGDAAEFKEWVGLSDSLIELQPLDGLPELPSCSWTEGRTAELETLTTEEWADIQLAAKAYLWGDSRLVSSYKTPIELFFGPFEVDVFIVPRLVIEPGATLIVSGRPTALLCDTIELHEGGSLHLRTVTRMQIHALNRLSLAH